VTVATARMSGRGDETLLFVHGVGSTAAVWDEQLEAFADYRCLAVELRGNGAGFPEPARQSITREGYVDDVLTVADAAGAQRFHFIGCSLGGVVGFELWKRAPERVRTLTLIGSFAAYPNAGSYVESIIAGVRAAGTMARFAIERAARLGLAPGKRTDETVAQMACKSIASYEAATHATWTGDYRAMLAQIAVPALVICGERDAITPPALSQEIAAHIPGSQFVVMPGAGHVANADDPLRFNDLLRAFLEGRR
jgi:pimeloyl-ACP methyl ester carboxylesterase